MRTKVIVTVFDSLVYDSENKILFVVIDSSKYAFEESEFDRQAELTNIVKGICPSLSTIKLIDFFPCIEGIYLRKTEGIVHKLSFECNTGAVRDESLKQGQLDLRDERYHTSGKAAIGGVIRPYKLGVAWHPTKYDSLKSELDVVISGARKNLHKGGGVFSCEVRSHNDFYDLCFALERVVLYADF